jgi:hypothetical protein
MYCNDPSNIPIRKLRNKKTANIAAQDATMTTLKEPLSRFVVIEFILDHILLPSSHKIHTQNKIIKADAEGLDGNQLSGKIVYPFDRKAINTTRIANSAIIGMLFKITYLWGLVTLNTSHDDS